MNVNKTREVLFHVQIHRCAGVQGARQGEREDGERGGDGEREGGWAVSARPRHSLLFSPPDTAPHTREPSLLAHPPDTMEDNVPCLTIDTAPFEGQKPGTSGLRKKVREGRERNGRWVRKSTLTAPRPAGHALAPRPAAPGWGCKASTFVAWGVE